MANKNFPTISIIVPTYNEKDTIHSCLTSIFKQDYPKEKMEVIVVDNDSTDGTLQIAKKFPVKILFNKAAKNSIVSKRIGFENSKGEFYIWIDSDMEISSSHWLRKMIEPLTENSEIVATLGCFKIKGDETPLTQFLTMDYNQRDPIYQVFSPSIYETIVEKKDGYYLCEFSINKIPPHGLGVFRRNAIKKTLHLQGDKLMELDMLAHLVNMGYTKYAFVEDGIYHYFMPDLKTLLNKRIRNIKRNYLGQTFKRSYTWFDLKNPKDIAKIILWIIYVHLIIPETVRGTYKSIKYKKWAGMYQPIVSLLETDVIICGLLYYYLKFSFKR